MARHTLFLCAMLSLVLQGCHRLPALDRLDAELVTMEECRRAADNVAFYRSSQTVQKDISRLSHIALLLSDDASAHLAHDVTQFQLQSAHYYYIMGQKARAEHVMQTIDEDNPETSDTRQWLVYRYLSGVYGYGPDAGRIGVRQCQTLLHQLADGDDYWRMEAAVADASLLTAGGNYTASLDTLTRIEPLVLQAGWPEVLCRLYEQMSVAYAGLDDKPMSDEYRNRYLDLLYEIREDKELPLRKSELEERWRFVNRISALVGAGMALVAVVFFFLARRWNRRTRRGLRELDRQMEDDNLHREEQYAVHALQTEQGKRDNVMRKASLSILTGIIPLIDRMRYAVLRTTASNGNKAADYTYVDELALEIERQNAVLTDWIQTRQGLVNLHIETFNVQELFDILGKNTHSFTDRGLTFDVRSTDSAVKADRSLTLFMLSTLTDNARKYTPRGGQVVVKAEEGDGYVELSVSDTGVGLSPDDVTRILNEKVYDASRIGLDNTPDVVAQKGSGFGLMNCKGIIEKYRKTDDFFAVCRFGVDSAVGKGSRFWFRLPKAVRRALLLVTLCGLPLTLPAQTEAYDSLLDVAADYADKVYQSNVEQRYADAFVYADSAFRYINLYRVKYATQPLPVLTPTGTGKPLERKWWMSDFATDYHTLLDLRNELAVASLALHRWDDYRYNNRAYTELYKLLSVDETLVDYCRSMRRSTNRLIWNTLLGMLTMLAVMAGYYLLCWRPRKRLRRREEARKRQLALELEESSELRRIELEESRLYVQNQVLDNCLSTIKHETLSYPGRIHHLVETGRTQQLPELVDYYSEIYHTLVACAARQVSENTFRSSALPADELMDVFRQRIARRPSASDDNLPLTVASSPCVVECDRTLMRFFMETLADEALTLPSTIETALTLRAESEDGFVRFTFTDSRPTYTREELQEFFAPSPAHAHIIMRQIIREHDEYYNHPGCRIEVRGATPKGIQLTFTLPERGER